MKNLIVLLLVFCSCRTTTFLDKCFAKVDGSDYAYLTSIEELKSNLSKKDYLFYQGSSDEFHYFIHFSNTGFKRAIYFKLPLKCYNPKNEFLYDRSKMINSRENLVYLKNM